MKVQISSTEAVRRFGDCLARIRYRGDSFVITRNDQPIAELGPAEGSRRATWAEIKQVLAEHPADPDFAKDLESVNESDQIPGNPWD